MTGKSYSSTSSWIDIPSAREIQKRLTERVFPAGSPDPADVKIIAGTDASISPDKQTMIGVTVLLQYPSLEIINVVHSFHQVDFPYIPGYLSFREVPVLLRTFEQLPQDPDLMIVDGQGTLHPRFFGLACHLGMITGWPTIGCAKSHLVGEYEDPCREKNAVSSCNYRGREIGRIVRTRTGVKPVWVSPGNRINMDAAVEWVLRCTTKYRLPEPTRLAHYFASRIRHQFRNGEQ